MATQGNVSASNEERDAAKKDSRTQFAKKLFGREVVGG